MPKDKCSVHATAQPKVIDILKKSEAICFVIDFCPAILYSHELNPSNLAVNANVHVPTFLKKINMYKGWQIHPFQSRRKIAE